MVGVQGKARLKPDHQVYSSKRIFILVSFIIIASIVDTSIVRISAFTGGLSSDSSGIAIFVAMALVFSLGQYLILAYVRRSNQKGYSNDSLRFASLQKWITVAQYVSIIIFAALILQLVITSTYNILFLELIVWFNYIVAIILLALLSQRFISWFRSNHNAIVLAYALAMIMICTNGIFTILYVTNQVVGAHGGPIIQPALTPVANYDRVYDIFNAGYFVTSIASFILTWIATVVLLNSYSKKFGRSKYWILVSVPLVYFLSQFQYAFVDLFTPLRASDPVLFGVVYTLFFEATIPVGGALFGIAFWSVARNIDHNAVKQYMMISAYGMMLLFSSNQASGLAVVPYPPFGLATVSFLGIASFLIFIGIYSTAISVAQDSQLRKTIRGFTIEESRLLDSIGSAQMEQSIMKRAIAFTNRNRDRMIQETGIESSLSEDDIKQYLNQVIEEVQNQKVHTDND